MSAIKNFGITQIRSKDSQSFFVTRSTYREAKDLVENHLKKQWPNHVFSIKVFKNCRNATKWTPADIYNIKFEEERI